MNAVTTEQQTKPSTNHCCGAENTYVSPKVNIIETDKSYTLEAEMPGVEKDNLEVTVEGQSLTITGHRTDNAIEGSLLHRESRSADFRREFELEPSIDAAKLQAQMDQGILRLTLPKAEAVQPRRIVIQ